MLHISIIRVKIRIVDLIQIGGKPNMRVTVFNGSPRGRKSNTHLIAKSLLKGAKQVGAQTEEVFLIEKDIQYCQGCFTCWGKSPGKCVINDNMADLIALFLESDFVGLATPVYGMYMSALLKNFTDRLLPLSMPHINKNEEGDFYHDLRTERFPRQFFIANSGFPGEHNFDLLKAIMGNQNLVLEIYRNCGEVLTLQDEEKNSELSKKIGEFNDAVRKAGREMVTNGQVSKETVEQIHLELISDEEYMAGANQEWDEEINRSKKE